MKRLRGILVQWCSCRLIKLVRSRMGKYLTLLVIMMVVHVDDFAIASSGNEIRDKLLQVLRSRYVISVSSVLESFLGVHLEYVSDGSVMMTQPSRVAEVIALCEGDITSFPAIPMSTLFDDKDQDDSELINVRWGVWLGRHIC
jgi:hypothetical protein